mgnify:CR=1 FL=1
MAVPEWIEIHETEGTVSARRPETRITKSKRPLTGKFGDAPDRQVLAEPRLSVDGLESTQRSHRLVRKADVPDQARLFCVACIRLVGWQYSEPSKRGLQIVEGLDNHATVHGDGFAESPRIEHRFVKNISELR